MSLWLSRRHGLEQSLMDSGNLVRPSSLLGHRTEATGCKGQPAATGTGPENMLALYLLLKLFS